jgi:hypothetical protein
VKQFRQTSALFFIIGIIAASLGACKKEHPTEPIEQKTNVVRWDFNDLDGWVDGSQNTGGPENYSIVDGQLCIETRRETWDRAKVHTAEQIYAAGAYHWRVYIPAMGMGDQASIGAFIYHSDQHELDFEIGYGTTADRIATKARSDELVVYTTCQDNPHQYSTHLIKREQWHDLIIKLELPETAGVNTYQATWLIDDAVVDQAALTFGREILFYIFCSVENLTFLGDHIPHQQNYALFDYIEYTP